MRRNKKKRDISSLPEYGFGDFLSKIKDVGIGWADTTLGTFGGGNIIKDSAYSNQKMADTFNKLGKIKNAVGNTALNVVVPGAGSALQGIQSAGDNLIADNTVEDNLRKQQLQNEALSATPVNTTTSINYKPVYACGGRMPKYPEGGPITQDVKQYKDIEVYHPYKDPFTGKSFWVVNRTEANKNNPDIFPIDYNEAGTNIMYGTYTAPKEGSTDYLPTTFRTFLDTNTTKVMSPSSRLNDLYFGKNPYSTRKNLANPELLNNPTKNAYYNTDVNFITQKAKGGFIDYSNRGDKHITGNDIPVDAMGNYNSNPQAKVEEGEAAYITPDAESYIMSDQLIHSKSKGGNLKTFADEAKKIKNKYKLRLGNDKITQEAFNSEMQDLMNLQEEVRGNLYNDMESIEYGTGGKIHIKPENKGKFTESANRAGMGVQEYARHVMAHKDRYSSTLVKRANFARNVATWKDGFADSQYIEPRGPEDYLSNTPLTPISGVIDNPISRPVITSNANSRMPSTETLFTGSVSPLGLVSTVAGNLALMTRNKKRKPANLDFREITPEQINLESARQTAIEEANRSRGNTFNALRNAGLSAGQYAANAITATGDIDRNLNNTLSSSYLNEQLQNAQFRQSAASQNAQANMQEQLYNRQLQDEYNAQQEQYLTNAINAVPQYLKDVQSAKQSADMLNVMNPNIQFIEDPTQSVASKILLGKRRKLKFKE